MNKITILGSSGQIGAYLTQYFTKKGYLVREFDIANGQHEDISSLKLERSSGPNREM